MSLQHLLFPRLGKVLLIGATLVVLASSISGYSPLYAQNNENGIIVASPIDAATTPTLLSPQEGAVLTPTTDPPLGVPILAWQAMKGVTKYQVQISVSDGFASTVVNVETESPSYTPVKALGNGIFYWRVRYAVGSTWSPYSEIRSFRVAWNSEGASRPLPLSPANGAVRAAFDHADFSWTATPGAATYRLRIARDEDMLDVVYTADTAALHHTPPQRLDNNEYYWRVTPFDKQGNAGAASEVWRFTFAWNATPQLLAPAPDIDVAFTPRFSWTAVAGAKEYRLQISTQENFNTFDEVITRNTDHTPVNSLSNDQDYFWRVQAIDARGINSPWSEVRRYRMKWNFTPHLLSPANNSIHLAYPFFSWKPVPGAERYQIQIANNNAFASPRIDDKTLFNVTNYVQTTWPSQRDQTQPETSYYWRIRAIDARNNVTPWSETWSFQFSDPAGDLSLTGSRHATIPNLVYPLPYYEPDTLNTPTHGDRSIAWPLFVWDTAHFPGNKDPNDPNYVEPADYYVLEVSEYMAITSTNFVITTTGLAAAPTDVNHFTNLQPGAFYYWQVTAYKNDQPSGSKMKWRTRYDPAVSQLPTVASAEAIFPADGFEAVALPPVLGWLPVTGATHYVVQIADDPAFANIVDEAKAQFVNYVPWQGRLTRMPYGAYWWRVLGLAVDGSPVGDWGTPRRFNLSVEMTIGNIVDYPPRPDLTDNAGGRTLITSNVASSGDEYALHDLYVTVDRRDDENYNQHWMIAFTAEEVGATPITYTLYFDTNHVAGSGGNRTPWGTQWGTPNGIEIDPFYLPEYVLYIHRAAGSTTTAFYRWLGDGWAPPQSLDAIRGFINYSFSTNSGAYYYQLKIPYTALGSADTDWVGSLALAVVSEDTAGNVRDTLPHQPARLSKPAFVSNMLLPLYPFDTPLSNPMSYEDIPPLRWRMPAYGSDGYQVQVARDARFTDIVETWNTWEEFSPHRKFHVFTLLPTTFQSLNAYANNESYYWRVRVRHEIYPPPRNDFDFGPWSPPMRFKLDSRQIGNPSLSTGVDVYMTPTFLWDRMEGAAGYTLQVDDDANFSSPLIDQPTDATSFTPTDMSNALRPGVQYYWRVVMRRSSNVIGHWTAPMTFTKSSVAPTPLPVTVAGVAAQTATIYRQPTLRWSVILTPAIQPRLAVPAYRLQVANNPDFTNPKINVVTQATSYTPKKGENLGDGAWYWRVALVDGTGNIGPFSSVQSFTKQYPPAPIISAPRDAESPVFAWTPIDGAAYYRMEYADNVSFNRSTIVTTDLTRYVPVKELPFNTYYWRVQMADADNNFGPIDNGQFTYFVPAAFTYTPNQGVAPTLVQFSDLTLGQLSTWKWDFGDGGTSIVRDPTYRYNAPGVYTVTMQNVTTYGFTRTVTITEAVRIYERAVARFSASPTSGSAPLQVAFQDQSTGDVNQWLWNFGDGSTSQERNPIHVYTQPGVYHVTLSVFGPGGSNIIVRQNYINVMEPPTSTPTPTVTQTPTEMPTPTTTPTPAATATLPPPIPIPTITRIEPDNDEGQRRMTVTIRGAGFTPLSEVYFGQHWSTSVNYIDPEQLQADKPSGMTRAVYDVRVCNPDQPCGELPTAFTVTVDDVSYDLYLPAIQSGG
jgi:PKD repeat protein